MDEQWVLLWSQRQNALHIEPMEKMLTTNRAAYAANRRLDYIVLWQGPKDLVEATANNLHGTLASRALDRLDRWEAA